MCVFCFCVQPSNKHTFVMSDDEEIDKILEQETSAYSKSVEISRILSTFPLDSYNILSLQPGCTARDIKIAYRKKSLQIHPDKTTDVRAPDAFDRLKKAEKELGDDKLRERLDSIYTDARKILIKEKKWTIHDSRLTGAAFLEEWREKVKEILIEEEVRRRRLLKRKMEEEGREQRKKEEQERERELKRKAKTEWEDATEQRVSNWRTYNHKEESKKKRKKAKKVLA